MSSSYYDHSYKILPSYSPQVLIGNWYEERFHYNRNHPKPEQIWEDGFRSYGANIGSMITPHEQSRSVRMTENKLPALEEKKPVDPETLFRERLKALKEKRISAEEKWKTFNLLNRSMQTSYMRDYSGLHFTRRWMLEAGTTSKDDRLGDRSMRQNHSHLEPYLPPADVPRLVAM